jgi:hypothetical protein
VNRPCTTNGSKRTAEYIRKEIKNDHHDQTFPKGSSSVFGKLFHPTRIDKISARFLELYPKEVLTYDHSSTANLNEKQLLEPT